LPGLGFEDLLSATAFDGVLLRLPSMMLPSSTLFHCFRLPGASPRLGSVNPPPSCSVTSLTSDLTLDSSSEIASCIESESGSIDKGDKGLTAKGGILKYSV